MKIIQKMTIKFLSILFLCSLSVHTFSMMRRFATPMLLAMQQQKMLSSGAFQATRPTLMKTTPTMLMSKIDAQLILDVEDGATEQEIQSQFRAKVKRYHPDAGGSNKKMQAINQAREILLGKAASQEYNYQQHHTQESSQGFTDFADFLRQARKNAQQQTHTYKDIWHATGMGNIEAVQNFLQSGIDINQQNYYKQTILLVAIEQGHLDLVKFLLQDGANPNICNPLLRACSISEVEPSLFDNYKNSQRLQFVQTLLDAHADPNMCTKDGYSPLMAAAGQAQDNEADVITALLQAGAFINTQTKTGNTALMSAATSDPYGNKVKILIEKGALLNPQDDRGNTALHRAINYRSNLYTPEPMSTINLLIDAKADLNIINNEGNTPLHCAVKNNSIATIALINAKADLNIVNNEGQTALDCAIKRDARNAIKALRAAGAQAKLYATQDKMDRLKFWKR